MTDHDERNEPDVHSGGTMAIVIVFGLLVGLAWLAGYVYVFLDAPY